MSEKITFTASDIRQIKAHETVADYGACYLNSLIGKNAADTCHKIEAVMPFIQDVIDREGDIDAARPVLSLLFRTIWTAVQYEAEMREVAA